MLLLLSGCAGGGGGGASPGGGPLSLSGLRVHSIGDTGVVVSWTTSVPSDGAVEYGSTGSYGASASAAGGLSTGHSVPLGGLSPATLYHYRAVSTDGSGGTARSGDATFTTAASASCTVFPADNPWNTDISGYPVHPSSASYLAAILSSGNRNLHPDFGGNGAYGIPCLAVPGNEPRLPINFTAYGGESDPGPYPIPLTAPIEGGASSTGDRHVIAVDLEGCKLYELFSAYPRADHWDAACGAVFDLRSNALRPLGWTSADAAGLPIYPGLVRRDEVAAGAVRHAIRVTFPHPAGLHPPRHPLRLIEHRPGPPAHGAPAAAEVLLRHLRLPGAGARDPRGAEALRPHRRGQRIELVHHRRRRSRLGRRGPERAQDGPRLGLRGGRHRAHPTG